MKTTHLQLKETKVNGEIYWQVTIPKAGSGRVRRTFKNKKDALFRLSEAKIQLAQAGPAAASMDDLLRTQAVEADRILRPYAVSILDVARNYVASRQASDKSCSVKDAVKGLLDDLKANGRSKRYLEDLDSRLGQFSFEFGTRKLSEVTPSQISSWLSSLKVSAVTRNNHRRVVSVLFSFGRARGWCAENPASSVTDAKEKASPIGILRPEQLANLLENASAETLPYWLIGAFCGLRSAELGRLDWKDVHFDSGLIEVTADNAKTARRRLIEMQPNLKAWLLPYRLMRGKVAPVNLRKLLEADRQRAGIVDWPSNALRHSFASYSISYFQNASKTALDLGHTDAGVVFEKYRELVRPDAAKQWWSIMPQSAGNVVEISA
jgi:integrase